jgi:hypothetical protein
LSYTSPIQEHMDDENSSNPVLAITAYLSLTFFVVLLITEVSILIAVPPKYFDHTCKLMMLIYTLGFLVKAASGFLTLSVANQADYHLHQELLKGLGILRVILIQIVMIDYIFKMKTVIDIITSESSFFIKTKLKRTRRNKYLLITLMTVSTLTYELVNYILDLWPQTFEENSTLLTGVSLMARLIYLLTFLWLTYRWVGLIKKFVQRKQAKLESQLLALTLRNKLVISWIAFISTLVVIQSVI